MNGNKYGILVDLDHIPQIALLYDMYIPDMTQGLLNTNLEKLHSHYKTPV